MSHDGIWRAACIITLRTPPFPFGTHKVARGVTDVGVGSGALLGSGAGMKKQRLKAGEKRGKTRDLIFREAVAIARMMEHALTRRLLRVLRRSPKATVVHARTVSQLHSVFPLSPYPKIERGQLRQNSNLRPIRFLSFVLLKMCAARRARLQSSVKLPHQFRLSPENHQQHLSLANLAQRHR
jgi:hypothetical protein